AFALLDRKATGAPAPPEPEARRRPRSDAAPARRPRILAIDDDALLLTAYRRMLGRTHDIETAKGGRAALGLLERDAHFDVILCDFMMPRLSGVDLYRKVAARWPRLSRRFIFLTDGAVTPANRRFLEKSGSTWIDKPIDRELLSRAIRDTLDKRGD